MNDMSIDYAAHYKAVRARIAGPVKQNVVRIMPRQKPVPAVETWHTKTVLCKPPVRQARTIYLLPIGPTNEPGRTIYPWPIGPRIGLRDVLNVASVDPNAIARKPPREIILEVCKKYKVNIGDVMSSRRTGELLYPRHEIFYRLRHETRLSLPQMGRLMGNRDHTTALSSIRRYTQLLADGKVSL